MNLPELHIEQWVAQSDILKKDLSLALLHLNHANEEDYGYYARSYIRTYAAYIEGSIWLYKQLIIRAEYQWHKSLPLASQLFLHEYDWKVASNGALRDKSKSIPTLDNIRAFFKLMQVLFPELVVDLSGEGWQSILAFNKKRNSIMHPTKSDALVVTSKDLEQLKQGVLWFEKVTRGLLVLIKNKIQDEINQKNETT